MCHAACLLTRRSVIPAANLTGGAANGKLREFLGEHARKIDQSLKKQAAQPTIPSDQQHDARAERAPNRWRALAA